MTIGPDFLLFTLDGQRFAIPLASAREVVRAVAITPLPGAPPVVEGVIDVRGAVVPVLDLRRRLGLASRPVSAADQMVLAWTGERQVALRVDRVEWMESIGPDRIEASDRITAGARHLAGVARLPDGIVLLHDLAAFLAQAEAEALDAALAAGGAGA